MAKLYESKAPNRLISTPAGTVRFRARTPGGYGELASDEPYLLAKTKLTPEQIEAIIERQSDFVDRVPGQAGIWLAEERIDATASRSFGAIRNELRGLGEAALRRKLAEAKLEVPVNATLDELASLVLEAMARGKLSAAESGTKSLTERPVRQPRPSLRRGADRARLGGES